MFGHPVGNRPVVVVLVDPPARYEWKKLASPDQRICGHPFEQRDRREGSHRSSVTEAAELKLEETEAAAHPSTGGGLVLT